MGTVESKPMASSDADEHVAGLGKQPRSEPAMKSAARLAATPHLGSCVKQGHTGIISGLAPGTSTKQLNFSMRDDLDLDDIGPNGKSACMCRLLQQSETVWQRLDNLATVERVPGATAALRPVHSSVVDDACRFDSFGLSLLRQQLRRWKEEEGVHWPDVPDRVKYAKETSRALGNRARDVAADVGASPDADSSQDSALSQSSTSEASSVVSYSISGVEPVCTVSLEPGPGLTRLLARPLPALRPGYVGIDPYYAAEGGCMEVWAEMLGQACARARTGQRGSVSKESWWSRIGSGPSATGTTTSGAGTVGAATASGTGSLTMPDPAGLATRAWLGARQPEPVPGPSHGAPLSFGGTPGGFGSGLVLLGARPGSTTASVSSSAGVGIMAGARSHGTASNSHSSSNGSCHGTSNGSAKGQSQPLLKPVELRPVTDSTRRVLVDWLVQVADKIPGGLRDTTVERAFHIMDRALSRAYCSRGRLQSLALVCLSLAVKYEEVDGWFLDGEHGVMHFLGWDEEAAHDEGHDDYEEYQVARCELLALEGRVLTVLDYRLHGPTPRWFLEAYLLAAKHTPPPSGLVKRSQWELQPSLGPALANLPRAGKEATGAGSSGAVVTTASAGPGAGTASGGSSQRPQSVQAALAQIQAQAKARGQGLRANANGITSGPTATGATAVHAAPVDTEADGTDASNDKPETAAQYAARLLRMARKRKAQGEATADGSSGAAGGGPAGGASAAAGPGATHSNTTAAVPRGPKFKKVSQSQGQAMGQGQGQGQAKGGSQAGLADADVDMAEDAALSAPPAAPAAEVPAPQLPGPKSSTRATEPAPTPTVETTGPLTLFPDNRFTPIVVYANYLCELVQMDVELVGTAPPSAVAAAALLLARRAGLSRYSCLQSYPVEGVPAVGSGGHVHGGAQGLVHLTPAPQASASASAAPSSLDVPLPTTAVATAQAHGQGQQYGQATTPGAHPGHNAAMAMQLGFQTPGPSTIGPATVGVPASDGQGQDLGHHHQHQQHQEDEGGPCGTCGGHRQPSTPEQECLVWPRAMAVVTGYSALQLAPLCARLEAMARAAAILAGHPMQPLAQPEQAAASAVVASSAPEALPSTVCTEAMVTAATALFKGIEGGQSIALQSIWRKWTKIMAKEKVAPMQFGGPHLCC